MGSMLHLALGNLEVDWGKNNNFIHHGALFQANDLQDVPYQYYDTDTERIFTVMKEGYSWSLIHAVKRIELLGYTFNHAHDTYRQLLRLHELDPSLLPFDVFLNALKRVDVTSVSPHYEEDHDFGEFFVQEMCKRLNIVVPRDEKLGYRRDYDVGRMMENFHPWLTLRLLAENPKNLDVPVVWGFADVVEGGWIEREDVLKHLSPASQFLIVTEGTSDAKIFKHAVRLLRPEIADFFRFVDMEEGYPFSGTGNLYRFCQGLVSIGILNQILIVYDNDAEGSARYLSTRRLALPPNMRVMKLPDLPLFESFQTTGPNGRYIENINGRAAAIECYLDLDWRASSRQPCVQWRNFNKELEAYHGELMGKEMYARRFLDLRQRETGYNFCNIEVILEKVIAECVLIAESAARADDSP
jgi:hypothetical protein